MTPRRARAPKGKRAYDSVPKNYGENVTFMAALTTKGISAAMALNGPADEDAFVMFLEEVLVPTLKPGKIVIMDNVGFHHTERVKEVIEAAKCKILYLPAYSPDFSPIENCFSKVKEFVRRAKARTIDALIDALHQAVELVTPKNAKGWFRHCGYDFFWR